MNYAILTDAACDLDPGMSNEAGFAVVPMEFIQGSETCSHTPFADTQLLKEFYNRQRDGILSKTSQIAAFQYETVMRSWLDRNYSVLYLALSGGLSSTYQTARLTGEKLQSQYPGLFVSVIDTKAATGGMGILAERAVRNRENGMSILENTADIQIAVQHIRHWFLVSDLMYLQRGGRISMAAASVGTLFHVHPILTIDTDGKLKIIGKARGKHKAVRELTERYDRYSTEETSDPVYVVDADAPDIGEMIQDKLLKNHPNLTIRRCTLSPIIGTHTGPGMAAIIHIGR